MLYDDEIEPATATLAAGCYADFVADGLEFFADGVELFGGEGAAVVMSVKYISPFARRVGRRTILHAWCMP